MADVSLGRALGSGFALIKRRPASVLVWGLLHVIFVQAPILALLAYGAGDLVAAFGHAGTLSEPQAADFAFGLQRRMMLGEAAVLPGMLVHAIVSAAVYRAVLEPKGRAFAYLRLGRQEAWLLLLALTFSVLVGFAILPLEGLVAVTVISLMKLQAPAALAGPAVAVLALAVILWAFARLSMAGPMTFSDRRFRLFESWSLTRRNGLALLGLALLLILVMVLIELVVVGVAAGAVIGLGAGHAVDPRAVLAWLESPRLLDPVAAASLAALALVAAAIVGALNAIAVAPWATAYGQLKDRPNAWA